MEKANIKLLTLLVKSYLQIVNFNVCHRASYENPHQLVINDKCIINAHEYLFHFTCLLKTMKSKFAKEFCVHQGSRLYLDGQIV